MELLSVNGWAIIVAAVVKFAIGAVWFTALFGDKWRKLQGIPEGAPPSGLVTAMVVQIIGDLVMAYILARFIAHYGATTLPGGVLIGFMAWLGFVLTVLIGGIFYEKKPAALVAISSGYQLVGIVVMGGIIGWWH